MSRSAALLGLVLLLLGATVFLWKTVWLGMPIRPSQAENLWRVELEVDARGSGERGSVAARLPTSDAYQVIFDEQLASDRLLFTIRSERGERIGVWRGTLNGLHRLTHGFRVQLRPPREPASLEGRSTPPPDIALAYLGGDRELPVEADEVRALLGRLDVAAQVDPPARLRTVFAFVSEEIETAPAGSDDALLTLAAREGSRGGKARLLATLLRAVGVPARLAAGLRLAAPRAEREVVYAHAFIGEGWVPLFPTLGLMARRPDDLLVMRRGGAELVEAVGLEAASHRYKVLREEFRPEELAALMAPANPILAALSLYRLPVATQATLRVLMLIPLAVLIAAVFRNVVGLRTFGTFMPILIALALRTTGLVAGLLMVFSVLLVGVAGRLLLDRFRLLFVPRLCVLLCLVVLVIAGLALLGHGLQSRDLLTGVLFPIVILTMLVERFSITTAEEGFKEALVLLVNSSLLAICAYPLFYARLASHLMFGYPELVLCVMGLLVMIGGYTGYRLWELVRFRALGAAVDGGGR